MATPSSAHVTYFTPQDELNVINRIPLEAISQEKKMLLYQSVIDPKFYITIISFNVHPTFISYKLEVGVLTIDKKECMIKHVQTRYSQIKSLYDSLKNDSHFHYNLPSFPGKKWFNNLTRETGEDRMIKMNPFIEFLNKIPSIRSNNIFKLMFSL